MGEWYSAGECAKKPAGARADFHLCSLFRALEQSISLTLEKESPVAPHLYQVNPSACQCTMASRQLVGKQRQLVGKQEGPQPPQKKCRELKKLLEVIMSFVESCLIDNHTMSSNYYIVIKRKKI